MKLPIELRQAAPAKARIVLESIVEAVERYGLFPVSGQHDAYTIVIVGLSGGADSVCLLHALHLLAPHWKLDLHVAHVDHSLRENSSEDAVFANRMADDFGLPFHVRKLDANELVVDPNGIEAAARKARYAFLCQCTIDQMTATNGNVKAFIAVGHHMDDQAETVLMNMIRGSGLRGLGGMPWSRPFAQVDQNQEYDINLVRPLLGTSKAAILAYLDAFQLSFREDESNSDMTYMRNRIRHETMPNLAELNPHIVETLSRTAELCRAEADRTELLDERILSGLMHQELSSERISMRLDMLLDMPLAPQRGILQCACKRLGVDTRELGFDAIDYLLATIARSQVSSGPHTLIHDVVWTLLAESSMNPPLLAIHRSSALPYEPDFPYLGMLYPTHDVALDSPGEIEPVEKWSFLCERYPVTELPMDWRNGRDPWRVYMDSDVVQRLQLTTARQGMMITPLGMGGQHKSIGDIFTDKKIASAFRGGWPVVMDIETGDIVWLCGLCLSENVKITSETDHVLALSWKKR